MQEGIWWFTMMVFSLRQTLPCVVQASDSLVCPYLTYLDLVWRTCPWLALRAWALLLSPLHVVYWVHWQVRFEYVCVSPMHHVLLSLDAVPCLWYGIHVRYGPFGSKDTLQDAWISTVGFHAGPELFKCQAILPCSLLSCLCFFLTSI